MEKTSRNDNNEQMVCPIGRFFARLEAAGRAKSRFKQHLSQSRIEFLKAFRSLIDECIEALEKGEVARGQKKASRIKVE